MTHRAHAAPYRVPSSRFPGRVGALLFAAAPLLLAVAIPMQPLDRGDLAQGSVRIEEVMAKEVPGVVTEYVAIAGPARYVESPSRSEERVWLALDGRAAFVHKARTFAVTEECIARAPLGETWTIDVPAGSTLRCIRFRKELSEEDRLEYAKFPAHHVQPYFRRFLECVPYREAIKSPKTTSRTLLPQDIVPRMALGTVETTGPDEVGRHKHPMLEQFFVSLRGNRCTVSADAEQIVLPELAILHIPLGSMHGAKVAAGDKLYYIWVDCFTTKEGQEWLKTHKPITEAPAPAR